MLRLLTGLKDKEGQKAIRRKPRMAASDTGRGQQPRATKPGNLQRRGKVPHLDHGAIAASGSDHICHSVFANTDKTLYRRQMRPLLAEPLHPAWPFDHAAPAERATSPQSFMSSPRNGKDR